MVAIYGLGNCLGCIIEKMLHLKTSFTTSPCYAAEIKFDIAVKQIKGKIYDHYFWNKHAS